MELVISRTRAKICLCTLSYNTQHDASWKMHNMLRSFSEISVRALLLDMVFRKTCINLRFLPLLQCTISFQPQMSCACFCCIHI